MKKQVSVTGLVTALLLGFGAVLLCAQLSRLSFPLAMEFGPALLIELCVYTLALVALNQSYTILGYLIGIAGTIVLRLLISVGTTVWVAGQADASILRTARQVFTSGPALLAAVVFAVIMFIPFSCLLPQREKKKREPLVAPKHPEPAGQAGPSVAAAAAAVIEQATAAKPTQPAPSADYIHHLLPRSVPAVEGAVRVPFSVITDQLPASLLPPDGPAEGEAELPINLILPELQEGAIKLALAVLVQYLPTGVLAADVDLAAVDDAPELITLPLQSIVEQLPPAAFEVGEIQSPVWARIDPELESTLFAQA